MRPAKKITVYVLVALGYVYVWIDGGTVGHILALVGAITTVAILVLNRSFSKAAAKAERSSSSSGPKSHSTRS
jgi:hypothetical protein